VALRADAEKEGKELAGRFRVRGYPTMVFVDPSGKEVDRIVGYLPPEKFLAELERIRSGDTFAACLERLEKGGADPDLVRRVARGFLDRAQPEEVVALLRELPAAGDDPECVRLLFEARSKIHWRAYVRAVRALLDGKGDRPEVAEEPGTRRLAELLARTPPGTPPSAELAAALREARRADGAELLATLPEAADAPLLFAAADLAVATGNGDRAAELYAAWWRAAGEDAAANRLNEAAWNLYLVRTGLDTALAMARRAHELDDDPAIADTLARLLYVTGERERALELERAAMEAAPEGDRDGYAKAVAAMERGEELGDRAPFDGFAAWPRQR